MRFDLPAEALEHRDAILARVIEAGVPAARGQSILDEYYQEQATAGYRLARRLDRATRACEAVTRDRRGRLGWCDQAATTTRDGHRACRGHAHGRVTWELVTERRASVAAAS